MAGLKGFTFTGALRTLLTSPPCENCLCSPVGEREAVLRWMTLLCKELAHRIRVDRQAWSRRATKLTLHTISVTSGSRYEGSIGELRERGAAGTCSALYI